MYHVDHCRADDLTNVPKSTERYEFDPSFRYGRVPSNVNPKLVIHLTVNVRGATTTKFKTSCFDDFTNLNSVCFGNYADFDFKTKICFDDSFRLPHSVRTIEFDDVEIFGFENLINSHITKLNLSKYAYVDWPSVVEQMTQLEEFSITGWMPNSIFNVNRLTNLKSFTFIPTVYQPFLLHGFQHLTSLENLSIRPEYVDEQALPDLTSLKKLMLHQLDQSKNMSHQWFIKAPNLEELHIDLPVAFPDVTDLRHLPPLILYDTIQSNPTLLPTISSITTLTKLKLTGNCVTHLSCRWFEYLVHIQELWIDLPSLHEIPDNIDNLRKLRSLTIEGEKISLPSSIGNIMTLKKLEVPRICSIPSSMVTNHILQFVGKAKDWKTENRELLKRIQLANGCPVSLLTITLRWINSHRDLFDTKLNLPQELLERVNVR